MGHLPPVEAGLPGDVSVFSRLVRPTGAEGAQWIRDNMHDGDLYFFLGYQENEDAMAAAANTLGVWTIFITLRAPAPRWPRVRVTCTSIPIGP